MPCFSPLQAYSDGLKSNGKRNIVFHKKSIVEASDIEIPCGQCIGCRLERSRQWAMRCVHEQSLHDFSCFITLTYSDEFLPKNGSLDVTHFQRFMKRLRKRFGNGIRFFHCGEYGDEHFRPHYHAILFGIDFTDPAFLCKKSFAFNVVSPVFNKSGEKLFNSSFLSSLWPYGLSSVGTATFESAAYVARYVCKKVNGKNAKAHYERIDPFTGEIVDLKPEYVTMSRRPGVGADWFNLWSKEVYPSDEVVLRDRKMRPPRFYDYLLEFDNPELLAKLKDVRMETGKQFSDNNTFARRKVREVVQRSKLNVFKVDSSR